MILRIHVTLQISHKGQTQQQAVNEIMALPQKNALRKRLLELLYHWHIEVTIKTRLTKDDKELLMNLTSAAQKYKEEILRQTRQEGLKEGQKEGQKEGRLKTQQVFVKNWLRAKFGKIDKALSKVVKPLVQLSPEESSRLLMRLSREELLEKFGQK
ncbi:conserved hypothetical protein [Beggiatoa sp. PS]|nr:conserved hypothetical protein [Beggiatoa sp. PS]